MKATTGARISELGVRTVLAFNVLSEFHVDDDERQGHLKRIEQILEGQSGIGHSKAVQRSLERCANGVWN